MAGVMQRSLADGRVCFASEFISGKKTEDIQKTFLEQLKNYREELIQPLDTTTGISKIKYTGKSTGKKDDMAICAQIALYFSDKKRLEPGFRQLAQKFGWRY